MRIMSKKQKGIGFLGWSSILAVFGFFVLLGLRIFPLYSEKLTVLSAMENVSNKPNVAKMSTTEIYKLFQKQMDLANTTRFNKKTMKNLVKIKRDKKTKKKYMHVTYEGRNEFMKDIKLLIEFDHKVELGGSSGK